MNTNTSVLISGASIAGPALAYWLNRYGCTVTVVERAPALRAGGQAVDFKGATHRTVLERMGILDEVYRRQTDRHDQTVIDARGTKLTVIPAEFTAGDVEIRRGDLAELLYERTADTCEYLFGDSITSLTETGNGVHVTFQHAAPRTFDLVVGADGIHSNVRKLAFGPESDYVTFNGSYYALAEIDEHGDAVMYNEPGRMVAVGGPKASAFFVFNSAPLTYDRNDTEQQKALVRAAYEGAGWRVPELLEKIPAAGEFYLDSLAMSSMEHYSTGRIVLLGDAAYGNTLAGFGTGLAIVGAYVLAGELAVANGDYRTAFANYETLLKTYSKGNRKANAGPFLAPPTRLKMRLRNLTFASKLLLKGLLWITDRFATDIELKDYPAMSRQPTGTAVLRVA